MQEESLMKLSDKKLEHVQENSSFVRIYSIENFCLNVQNEFRGGGGRVAVHPFCFPDEQAVYLANASFHLESGMSSSISIPWNLAFCFLFVLSFSPFFQLLPSSSSLSSSSSVSLPSLCLDLRYSSHLSG